MATTWRSNLPAFNRASDAGDQAGLKAGAYIVFNAVRRNLRGGFTTGDFVTGESVNHVTIGPVYRTGTGWGIKVGTDLLYNLFWTLGHYNIYTRSFQRVDKWTPGLVDNRFAVVQAYNREYTRHLKAAGL